MGKREKKIEIGGRRVKIREVERRREKSGKRDVQKKKGKIETSY